MVVLLCSVRSSGSCHTQIRVGFSNKRTFSHYSNGLELDCFSWSFNFDVISRNKKRCERVLKSHTSFPSTWSCSLAFQASIVLQSKLFFLEVSLSRPCMPSKSLNTNFPKIYEACFTEKNDRIRLKCLYFVILLDSFAMCQICFATRHGWRKKPLTLQHCFGCGKIIPTKISSVDVWNCYLVVTLISVLATGLSTG